MKYTILPYDDSQAYGLQRYLVDKEDDIKELSTNCGIGSKAIVAESGNTYLLNNEHKWKLQAVSSGSSIDFANDSFYLEQIGETEHITYTNENYSFSDGSTNFGIFVPYNNDSGFNLENSDSPTSIRLIKDLKIYINGQLVITNYPDEIIRLRPDYGTVNGQLFNSVDNKTEEYQIDETEDGFVFGLWLEGFGFNNLNADEMTFNIPSVPLYKFSDSLIKFTEWQNLL